VKLLWVNKLGLADRKKHAKAVRRAKNQPNGRIQEFSTKARLIIFRQRTLSLAPASSFY